MTLSCSCDYEDDGDAPWYFHGPHDYKPFPFARGKRCMCSGCSTMIRWTDTCAEVKRTRCAADWEDARGFGAYDDTEAVDLASAWMCERCADLYFSLRELGFECVSPYESMTGLCKQYAEKYYGTGKSKEPTNSASISRLLALPPIPTGETTWNTK